MTNHATEITKKSLEEMDLKELFLMSKDIEDLISALFQRQSIIQEVIGQHLEDVKKLVREEMESYLGLCFMIKSLRTKGLRL